VRACKGPRDLGDVVLHSDTRSEWNTRTRASVRYFRVWRPVGVPVSLEHFKPHTQLALLLYGVPSEGQVPRKRVSGHRLGWQPYS
jgi:hypothetical protein